MNSSSNLLCPALCHALKAASAYRIRRNTLTTGWHGLYACRTRTLRKTDAIRADAWASSSMPPQGPSAASSTARAEARAADGRALYAVMSCGTSGQTSLDQRDCRQINPPAASTAGSYTARAAAGQKACSLTHGRAGDAARSFESHKYLHGSHTARLEE